MWADALIVSAACFVAAFCAGVAGFAFVLVAAAILLHLLPPSLTAPVLVLGSLLVQSLAVPALWRDIEWRRLGLFVAAASLGLPLGLWLLWAGPARLIVAGVGVLLTLYAGYMLGRILLRMSPPRLAGGRGADAAVAIASGVLGGIGGFVGALPAMWADAQGWPPARARALMQPFIAVMQAITIPGLALGGFFTREALWLAAAASPAMLAGSWLGWRAYRRLPMQGFRIALLCLLLLSGLSLLA
ncbi:MAG: sulfite exporter TauE/SafE family protein [Rhodovarius sp.]|nr:sulfite exporter TauE/SafE family protein [Rhodovarius sp.]MCX7932347.1 sulfite exporter TauE/SafE family protein [Rhodovarius sp.]MDW8314968.1 sulfite exporter TauE/SafE family protein [Rhodovarius sp.]